MAPTIQPMLNRNGHRATSRAAAFPRARDGRAFAPPGGAEAAASHGSAFHAGPGSTVFTVADTGPGIPGDQRGRVFEPFQQADGSITRAAGGTGLGLSIARTLTELLGGRIGLESEVGRGTTFTVVLPPRIPARAPAAARPVLGGKDILVVGASPPAGDAVRLELGAGQL